MKYLIASLLILSSFSAVAADSSYSGDSLSKLYLEMKYLYHAGTEVHQQFTAKDRVQLKACKDEYGYISTRARALVGMANRLNHPNKEEFIDAAWRAYACVTCGSPVSSCEALPDDLAKIKAIITQ